MWYLQNVRNMNLIHKTIKKLFWEENKVPEHCMKLESWQGPPHINKVKKKKSFNEDLSSPINISSA